MVGTEKSGVSFSCSEMIDSIIMCTPVTIMMVAIIIVVMRSIKARWLDNLWERARFSPIIMIKPEIESMKL